MRLDRAGNRFLVIGENIHCTRVLRRTGRHAQELPDGGVGIVFEDAAGARRVLPVHPDLVPTRDFTQGKIKHVASAVLWGLDGLPGRQGGPNASAEHAATAAAYVQALARRQEAAGADWLDLNADEISPDPGRRAEAIAWLVMAVEAAAQVPVAVDSSDIGVLAAGVAASTQPRGQLLLNSASLERPEVLDLAADTSCAVVLAAAGEGGMPTGAEDRTLNAIAMVELAMARNIEGERLFVDPLVLPVAVAGEAAASVLACARELREEYGSAIHLTGGLSNVSFGMPNRRLLNDVYIDLAADAGIDSGIIDPVASDLGRLFGADRDGEAWRLAADVLLGRDPFGSEYVAAFREGRLGAAE